MCGICAFVYLRKDRTNTISTVSEDSTFQDIFGQLKRRGPNHFQETSCFLQDAINMHFAASVLHLRGTSPIWQPIKDELGNILLWNGEIFDGFQLDENASDTEVLSKQLFNCATETEVLSVISTIKGPFAFIFYQNTGLLWFGRDVFGRRSLLWNSDGIFFRLCSVASKQDKWAEVPTEGLFCLDLNQSSATKSFLVYLYPWSSSASGLPLQLKSIEELSNNNLTISPKPQYSVHCPVSNTLNRTLPMDNMLLDSQLSTGKELKLSDSELLSKLAEVPFLKKTAAEFEDVLSEAVKKRVCNHLHLCKKCYSERGMDSMKPLSCDHASVGVLFSGGLDSIVIACLADRHLLENQPIDLINVAFAKNSSFKGSDIPYGHPAFDTPDRITGRRGAAALCKVCPRRNWNFIEVNVTEDELFCKRRDVISHLLNPSCTVLDDSIGCALWFAAHGNGKCIVDPGGSPESYTSPARVLLIGTGADEQLGGYARHRAKFNVSGWSGLIEELSLELDRIGSRNLGRDDRIIADNGVESRHPFLDENVVSYLNNLPVWLKMNLNYPRGVGEKLLLRIMALNLGLVDASVLPKRAIQFGSRIARIENSKEKGSDVCERLKAL